MNEFQTRIFEGINNDEFFVEYQPVMCIDGQELLGAEVLVRWNRDGRIIYPGEFIDQVEGSVLTGPLTYYVVERALVELGDWLKAHPKLFLSFNTPPEILGRGCMWYVVRANHFLSQPGQFVVELTERGIPDMLGFEALIDATALGYRICLDDVTLSNEHLMVYANCGVDMIKLDIGFTRNLLSREDKSCCCDEVLGMIEHCTSHGKVQIIAEGIELEEQRVIYRDYGIPMGQGWLWSRSLKAEQFIEYYNSLKHKMYPICTRNGES